MLWAYGPVRVDRVDLELVLIGPNCHQDPIKPWYAARLKGEGSRSLFGYRQILAGNDLAAIEGSDRHQRTRPILGNLNRKRQLLIKTHTDGLDNALATGKASLSALLIIEHELKRFVRRLAGKFLNR